MRFSCGALMPAAAAFSRNFCCIAALPAASSAAVLAAVISAALFSGAALAAIVDDSVTFVGAVITPSMSDGLSTSLYLFLTETIPISFAGFQTYPQRKPVWRYCYIFQGCNLSRTSIRINHFVRIHFQGATHMIPIGGRSFLVAAATNGIVVGQFDRIIRRGPVTLAESLSSIKKILRCRSHLLRHLLNLLGGLTFKGTATFVVVPSHFSILLRQGWVTFSARLVRIAPGFVPRYGIFLILLAAFSYPTSYLLLLALLAPAP
jgi:hypothetical protein